MKKPGIKRYEHTVAADYYQAIKAVERRLALVPAPEQFPAEPGQLVALVDALSNWTLNDSQRGIGSCHVGWYSDFGGAER